MHTAKRSFWDLPFLNSRTNRSRVTLPEMVFGYFLGPLLVMAMTSVVLTYYLTFYRTYDDIVASGNFLVLLPLISVIPMALSNILVGVILGKTKTRQGKARPFILIAAPLLLLSDIAMFIIPYFSIGFRMAWMAVTYNLFAALANPVYSNAHSLMVSLSTRDLDQRGKLSVVANIPAVAGNGLVSSILMPAILSWIRSGEALGLELGLGQQSVQNRWQTVMLNFAVCAFVGCLLEYFFTRERITEEDISETGAPPKAETVSTARQLKAAAGDRYWWIIMIFYFLHQAGVMFKSGYIFNIFCNDFFPSITVFGQALNAEGVQSLLALIGGIPLAVGMLFAWPVANKIGKRNFLMLGCAISVLGSVFSLLNPSDFTIVLIGQILKGFSSIPGAYIMMALFADVLDHLEARNGFRVDGISMSVYSTILTVVNGLAVSFFNLLYDGSMFSHQQVASFFFLGFEIFSHGILFFVLLLLNVEKHIREEQQLIADRKKAKA